MADSSNFNIEVALNDLKIKTNSLPDDWLVSLINPKSGEPAEIMTIVRFIELLTSKIPIATKDSNGLMSKDIIPYNNIFVITLKEGEEYDLGKYYYCRTFTVTFPYEGATSFFLIDSYKNSKLIYGGGVFSATYGELNKISLGRKETSGNVFVCNKLSKTITIGIV